MDFPFQRLVNIQLSTAFTEPVATSSRLDDVVDDLQPTGDSLFDENITLWRRLAEERRNYADQLRSLVEARREQTTALRSLRDEVMAGCL